MMDTISLSVINSANQRSDKEKKPILDEIMATVFKDENKILVLLQLDNHPITVYKLGNARKLLGQLEDLVWRSGVGFCIECGQRIRRKMPITREEGEDESKTMVVDLES